MQLPVLGDLGAGREKGHLPHVVIGWRERQDEFLKNQAVIVVPQEGSLETPGQPDILIFLIWQQV